MNTVEWNNQTVVRMPMVMGKCYWGEPHYNIFLFIQHCFVSAMELLYNVCPKVLIGILFAQEGHVHQNRVHHQEVTTAT